MKFDSAFSPKTLKTIRKRTVTKTALNLTPRFRQQRSAMLLAFGENGEWSKTSNIWRIWTIFSKMLGVHRFVSISDWKMQKKFKNRLWTSRACVPSSRGWVGLRPAREGAAPPSYLLTFFFAAARGFRVSLLQYVSPSPLVRYAAKGVKQAETNNTAVVSVFIKFRSQGMV